MVCWNVECHIPTHIYHNDPDGNRTRSGWATASHARPLHHRANGSLAWIRTRIHALTGRSVAVTPQENVLFDCHKALVGRAHPCNASIAVAGIEPANYRV